MDKIIESYLKGTIPEDSLKQWLEGRSFSENNLDLSSLSDLKINTFVDHFVDNLHASFDWLIKQTSNVPLIRLNNIIAKPFVGENKVTIDTLKCVYL